MKIKSYAIHFIFLIGGIIGLYGQNTMTDSVDITLFFNNLNFEQDNSEEIYDFESMQENLETYIKHPLNVNQANLQQLQKMEIFSDLQIQALLRYREDYGKILGKHELPLIYGFSPSFATAIEAYLCFEDLPNPKLNIKNLKLYGKNTLIYKNECTTPSSQGYENFYLGSPLKMYIKYQYLWTDKISFGVAMEKDAGESFAWNDQTKIFDHWAFHLMLAQQKILFRKIPIITINKLILGNFHVQFGQGLCLASTSSFGGFTNANTSIRSGSGIKTFTSATEYGYLSGGACDLGIHNWDLRLFYSFKGADAKLKNDRITSLPQTGFHRSDSELSLKKQININAFGGNINYNGSNFRLGFTLYTRNFDFLYAGQKRLDNQFSITPTKSTHSSIDYHYFWKSLHVFGETALSLPTGWATLNGAQYQIPPRCALFIMHRYYTRDYQSFYSNGFGLNSKISNENGFRIGISLSLSPKMTLDLIADHYQFDWISYYVDAPLYGQYYLGIWNYQLSPSTKFSISGKYVQKTKMEEGEFLLEKTANNLYSSFTASMQHRISTNLQLKFKLQLIPKSLNTSYLLYQELDYSVWKNRIHLYARLTLFDTDGWNNRMYAYETDVYQSFSIPAFYDQGGKYYFMFKYEINRRLSLWIRYARLYFYGKNKIGSGHDEILGNNKQEYKLLLKFKF